MTAKKLTAAHIVIDLDDVRTAGSVESAIAAWCERSDDTACGVVGPAFSTSGPGSGWSVNHSTDDFARRALAEGALHYIDAADGRMISADAVDEGDEDGDDVLRDIGGCAYRVGDWSDESVVRLECPDIEDAVRHPAEFAAMARAVADTHGAESDTAEWRDLIARVRAAADALDGIEID